jgi:6-phospho-beta-glucosidase
MILTVIGGGGVRAPLFAASAFRRAMRLGLTELRLQDIDPRRLRLASALCREIARQVGSPVSITATTDLRAALEGADHIVTTLRVGGEAGRVLDERIALRLGLLGQETTGPGGFAMAMRSIPAILEIARLAQRVAPGAWIFNFTNPAGLVAQALHDAGFERVVGICDGANLAQHDLAAWLNLPAEAVRADVFGLNHLSWAAHAWVEGRDVLPAALASREFCAQSSLRAFDYSLVQLMGLYLNEYLYYYYYAERAVQQIRAERRTRGEEVQDLNAALLDRLEAIDIEREPQRALHTYLAYEKRRSMTYMHYARADGVDMDAADRVDFSQLSASPAEGEGYAGVALEVIAALGSGGELYTALNLPNQGAIPGFAAGDVVEVSARVVAGEITPLPQAPPPLHAAGLMHHVKAYERLAVEAILQRSIRLAQRALMLHPLVQSYDRAGRLLAEYLEAHAPFIGEWR